MAYKILKDGERINTIIADEAFCKAYCEENGYTYEAVEEPKEANPPSELEKLRADMDFIAMEMGVEL